MFTLYIDGAGHPTPFKGSPTSDGLPAGTGTAVTFDGRRPPGLDHELARGTVVWTVTGTAGSRILRRAAALPSGAIGQGSNVEVAREAATAAAAKAPNLIPSEGEVSTAITAAIATAVAGTIDARIAEAIAAAPYAPAAGPFAPTTTGATAATRYRGGTASGAPTAGTFAIGDFVIDRTGILWICTAAGTPGTWADASSSGHVLERASATSQQVGITAETDIVGLALPTFTVGARPVEVVMTIPSVGHTVTATTVTCKLTDAAGVIVDAGANGSFKTKAANDYGPVVVSHQFPAGTGPVTVKGRVLTVGGASQGFIVPTGATERRTIQAIVR